MLMSDRIGDRDGRRHCSDIPAPYIVYRYLSPGPFIYSIIMPFMKLHPRVTLSFDVLKIMWTMLTSAGRRTREACDPYKFSLAPLLLVESYNTDILGLRLGGQLISNHSPKRVDRN